MKANLRRLLWGLATRGSLARGLGYGRGVLCAGAHAGPTLILRRITVLGLGASDHCRHDGTANRGVRRPCASRSARRGLGRRGSGRASARRVSREDTVRAEGSVTKAYVAPRPARRPTLRNQLRARQAWPLSECLRCASKFIPRHAERSEDLCTHPFAEIEDAKQDVYRPDRLACSASLTSRYLEGALRAGRERNGATRRSLSLTNDASDLIENRDPWARQQREEEDGRRRRRSTRGAGAPHRRSCAGDPPSSCATTMTSLASRVNRSNGPRSEEEARWPKNRGAPADVALVGGLFGHPQAPSDLVLEDAPPCGIPSTK